MQTYNYLANELPRELIEVYNDLQSDVLKIIVKRLKQGESVEKVFQEIRDKVDNYNPQIEKVLQIIFADSKKKTVRDNKKEFEHETEEKQPVDNNEANSLIAPALISGLAILSQLNRKIVNNAVNKYSKDYTYVNSAYGNKDVRLKQVYKDLAKKGITIYESFGGGKSKNYSIENVLRRDVMYKVNQANAKVNMENFKKSSAMLIQTSSHPTARTWNKYMKHSYEDHSSWQGKLYYSKEKGVVEGFEEFESTCGAGQLLGIGGINCYHEYQLSYNDVNTATQYDKEKVEKNYNLSQQQRKLETAIRKLKQAKYVYEEAGEESAFKSISRKLSMATSQLKSFCEKNGLKYYNWRTKV